MGRPVDADAGLTQAADFRWPTSKASNPRAIVVSGILHGSMKIGSLGQKFIGGNSWR